MIEGQINAAFLQVSHAVTAIESGHRFREGSAERRVPGPRNRAGAFSAGSSAGMGLAAQGFAETGAAVGLADFKVDAVRAQKLVVAGHKAIAVPCDVSDDTHVAPVTSATLFLRILFTSRTSFSFTTVDVFTT